MLDCSRRRSRPNLGEDKFNIMARVIFGKGEQEHFLRLIREKASYKWSELAVIAGVSARTFYDWRTEKYLISLKAAETLSQVAGVPLPKAAKVLTEHWNVEKAAKMGADTRYKKYGNPGTSEGRRKGGLHCQALRRANPEKYRPLTSIKKIETPQLSTRLAEFVGIVIGDGYVTKYFTNITLSSLTEQGYAVHVTSLARGLFPGVTTSTLARNGKNAIDVRIYSKAVADFLGSIGLSSDKSVPVWISSNDNYVEACLRGLFDTEGSIGFKLYKGKSGIRLYKQLTFTNKNPLILSFVTSSLAKLGYKPTSSSKKNIYISNNKDISRFVREIGSRNPKLMQLSKINNYDEYSKFLKIGGLR